MQITSEHLTDTSVKLTISGDETQLNGAKNFVLQRFNRSGQIKVPGFRAGKAPLPLIEKNADQSRLQTEFLDAAVNDMYAKAIEREKVRPISQPQVVIKKFVPFGTLEVEITVDVLSAVVLPDYTKIKVERKPISVTTKDVNDVIEALRSRAAKRAEVSRAAISGDEVTIDFTGVDAVSNEAIQGADGKDYPLLLGSGAFIPGFEDQVIGMKPDEKKSFPVTFPEDYGVKALQNRAVTFTVTATKLTALEKPKVDDALAPQVGPFKTLAELKADIKKQLTAEKQQEADREYENQVITKVTEASRLTVPKSLVDSEIERMEVDEKQNLLYRGQTWQEHLKDEGLTEEQHREQKRPVATSRVKAGLVLNAIAEKEKLTVTPEELEIRLQLLKGQYKDKQMLSELDKPENQQDIMSRMITEKAILTLVDYSSKK